MADSSGIGQFRLTREEAIVLTSMQAYMMRQDRIASSDRRFDSDKFARRLHLRREPLTNAEMKANAWDEFTSTAVASLVKGHSGRYPSWAPSSFTGSGWADRFCDQLAGLPNGEQGDMFATAAPILAANITDRSRGYLLLIELVSFHPWPPKVSWDSSARDESLADLTVKMPPMTKSSLDEVKKKFKKAMRRLQRKNTNWYKIAGVVAGGVALGALTAGLAAPLIGAAIGGVMGLSGAAAASAGLAFLGGGSLAAGGMGMAGGTMLIAGLGGAAGATTLTGGAYLRGWTAGQVVAETIKLEVLTEIVILQEEGDDAVARQVVRGMEVRLREVEQRLETLAERLQDLAQGNKELRSQLEEQTKELELSRDALELAVGQLKEQLGMAA